MPIISSSYEGRKIYRVTEFDLLSIPKSENKIYACTDSRRLYEDISNVERKVLAVGQIDTEIDRIYTFKPANGAYYYVWETNELWLYNYGWELIIGDRSDLDEDTYVYQTGGIDYVNKSGGCCGNDNNGILGDGSVVVRDSNRLIKGKIYVDATDNDLVISSYLGGGLKLLPSGSMDEQGSLIIEDGILNYYGDAWINGHLYTTEDIMVVKDSAQYKVYTEEDFTVGEWEFDGNDVVDKLNALPQPVDINVKTFDGHTSDYYAKAEHTHLSEDITDLEEFVRDSREKALTSGLQNQGITVDYDRESDIYTFVPDSFIISLTNGVSGAASVRNLQDVSIDVTVDPLKHVHNISEIDGAQEKFDQYVPVSDTAEVATPNRLLYLDGSGNLPTSITGNSATTDKWKTSRLIQLINGVTGQVMMDGSSDVEIDVTVDPSKHEHSQYFLASNVGIEVPSLTNGKIPKTFLDDQSAYPVTYIGEFNPGSGLPTTTGIYKGYSYVASDEGTISGEPYFAGDWVIYDGSNWRAIHSKGLVHSVNGQTGDITIDPDTFLDDFVFDPENPQAGKIPLTVYDPDLDDYFVNVNSKPSETAVNAEYLLNPIPIQFTGGITSEVYYLYLTEDGKVNELPVEIGQVVANVDDGVIE